ncbi:MULTISPECIES: NADH-quinone oxidoreductase subunit J [Bacillaceae]|uniref:NADH-quinone oxidoreductase subunit J n=1 Tax=Bacillaceae TaxID=186817 RepID=UPI000C77756D|nr:MULTISPECIES: NADH-quinone oxidoreductase subunit J [Bacillaceae]PLR67889.1 NADH-quinone oxidoreductase subunit J [Bacillus sp. UMB0893]QNG60166.1 NADH-quinone oxidoreductase subunit J [Bacillus sp. PAMC26568]
MSITGEYLAFVGLAIVAIGGGILMLNVTKVVHMVVSLVFTFVSIAGLYVLLSAEFVAAVQILIYSGAITIIMLFGIMLTRHEDEDQAHAGTVRKLLTFFGIAAFAIVMYLGIYDLQLGEPTANLHVKNTEQIGISLYSHFVIPFELTSVLLLVALVGAIILAKKDENEEDKK